MRDEELTEETFYTLLLHVMDGEPKQYSYFTHECTFFESRSRLWINSSKLIINRLQRRKGVWYVSCI